MQIGIPNGDAPIAADANASKMRQPDLAFFNDELAVAAHADPVGTSGEFVRGCNVAVSDGELPARRVCVPADQNFIAAEKRKLCVRNGDASDASAGGSADAGAVLTGNEAKQRQRQMETAMRAQREKVQMLQDGDADPDDVMLAKCKYQGQLDEYARFSKQMGLKQERERIYIDGRWRVAPGRIDKKLNVVNTMKISVPRDAYKIKGMTSEAKHEIEAAINNLKKEYDIRLDLIEVAKMEVGDIFGAAPYLDDRGKLRFALVINEDIDYNVVKKKIQRRYDKGRFAGKSIEDYIAHEMAHIMTYQDCKNEAEFRTRQRIVERQFMQGISQYADKTGKGEESLAEAFVCYRNKEKIPIRAELLIRSYIERWKK